MPHMRLEHTANIPMAQLDHNAFFSELTSLVSEHLGIDPSACKSGIIPLQQHHIGIGDEQANAAFAHLTILLLTGRDMSLKASLSEQAVAILQKHVEPLCEGLAAQLTVRVDDMPAETYSKVSNGG